jgi:hypothetical protein
MEVKCGDIEQFTGKDRESFRGRYATKVARNDPLGHQNSSRQESDWVLKSLGQSWLRAAGPVQESLVRLRSWLCTSNLMTASPESISNSDEKNQLVRKDPTVRQARIQI